MAKGEVLTPKDLDEKYSPKAEDVKKVVDWLKAPEQGLEVVGEAKDRSSVYVRGAVSKVEKALAVQFVRVTMPGDPTTYAAARNAPSLPAEIGTNVTAILGLQPFQKARTKSIRMPLPQGNRAGAGNDNKPRKISEVAPQAVAPAAPFVPPYGVADILKAYNADNLGVTGNGQTIAILIDRFPKDSDVKAFLTRNNLPVQPNIELVNVAGNPLPSIPEGEETLDTEWAAGIAPGAKVVVYASGSFGWSDLNRALDRITDDAKSDDGLRQLSISLGLGEVFNPRSIFDEQSEKFLNLAALGVNIFVSSGDARSNPAIDGHSRGSAITAEFGASSPYVVGVAGTTLVLDNSGGVKSETGWSDSGGGNSGLFDRPVWQKSPGVPPGIHRLVPDVALVADGNTGALVVLNGSEVMFGGTSWSAPVWAGFSALVNEGRVKAGKPRLPFLNPLLYSMSEADKAKAFRDITVGNNSGFPGGQSFRCTPGHDRVTGLGVPNVKELMRVLTGDIAPPPAPIELRQADFTAEAWSKLKAKVDAIQGLSLDFDGENVRATIRK